MQRFVPTEDCQLAVLVPRRPLRWAGNRQYLPMSLDKKLFLFEIPDAERLFSLSIRPVTFAQD
ncbi:MAG: hypothetical protein WBJ21_12745 [Burkholderiaceae bacterium]